MKHLKLATLRSLRDYMVARSGGLRPRRCAPHNADLPRQLDLALQGLRAARPALAHINTGDWLRTMRKATGVPVPVLATRLGVAKNEIYRLEKSEREQRIMLANLQRGAQALGCELVYALVPVEGSLQDLASEEIASREAAGATAKQLSQKNAKRIEDWLGMKEAARRELLKRLRKLEDSVR